MISRNSKTATPAWDYFYCSERASRSRDGSSLRTRRMCSDLVLIFCCLGGANWRGSICMECNECACTEWEKEQDIGVGLVLLEEDVSVDGEVIPCLMFARRVDASRCV